MPARVIVFGAGAVGGLFGALLARAGHEVVMVGRPGSVAAVRAQGLIVEGRTKLVVLVTAVERIAPGSRADWVLLTVKGRDVTEAARAIGASLAAPCPVIVLQNGLGIEALAEAGLGAAGWPHAGAWVVRAIHSYGATLVAPGVVRHAGDGEVLLPQSDGSLPAGTIAHLAELLRSAGLEVRLVGDIEREVWRKALVNAAVNPVTADHGVENGQLARDPWRGQAEALLREAQTAARLAGFEFSDEEADRELWKVVRATAKNRSSMLQDLDRGRATEIDTISGYLLTIAERHGVDLPHTRQVIARIQRKEARPASRPRP